MSVIQKIRDKYATVMILAICISLIAFLLMDALVGPKSFFQHSNDVAEVNGIGIDYKTYSSKLQQAKDLYKANNPNVNIDDATNDRIETQVWNQYLQDQILGAEYSKLGIGFTNAELADLVFTNDADPEIKTQKAFINSQTGMFDPSLVRSFVQSLQTGNQSDPRLIQSRNEWIQVENYLQESHLERKFNMLIQQGIYYPKWLVSAELHDENTSATISYVSVPYSTINDSSIHTSQDELESYLQSHKASFQVRNSRRLEFVSFDAIPTAADTAGILKQMTEMKGELAHTSDQDLPGYINRNSETQFFDGYLPGSIIQVPDKDSILSLAPGGMFGPYYDDNTMVVAKMIDKKVLPDTVDVQTILIGTQNIPDSEARNRVDSIAAAIRGGADFGAMAAKYSDDPGSRDNEGKYTLTPQTNFIPEFKHFAFFHKAGDMDTVISPQYGYFLIRIVDQKKFEPAMKIAYLSLSMDPSQETLNAAYSQASEFNGENQTQAAFDKAAQLKGLNKRIADGIHASDNTIPGIGQARDLVQWAFNAKLGKVSRVFTYDNRYVVAVLTGIKKKGTASLDDVRAQIEAAVKQRKKAGLIAQRIRKGSSLEQVSKSLGQPIGQAQNVSFVSPFMPNAGFEPRVVGASFDPSLGLNKASSPIFGNNGVYVIQVDSVHVQPAAINLQLAARNLEMNLSQQLMGQVFDALKKQTDIVDNRLKFF
ncbi:MAG TPA: SurA N-terminal domain-containing protein [Chitinophagaceae bacterium]|nr:SurA N-terminal domain-containing protein [Chitinophagaceae bacterium]